MRITWNLIWQLKVWTRHLLYTFHIWNEIAAYRIWDKKRVKEQIVKILITYLWSYISYLLHTILINSVSDDWQKCVKVCDNWMQITMYYLRLCQKMWSKLYYCGKKYILYSSSAVDTTTGQKVAIKKLARPFQSAVHAKRTYRELRMLKHMNHENVGNTQSSRHFTFRILKTLLFCR